MLNVNQFRELIIKPTLLDLVLYSDEAMELLVFTCAVESDGGTYLKQLNGPALGIYQMEPKTYNDIWENYLKNNRPLTLMLVTNFGIIRMPDEERMIYDLKFATAMARLHYKRVPEPLPEKNNVLGLWAYYKSYYNSPLGSAKKEESIQKYLSFINP